MGPCARHRPQRRGLQDAGRHHVGAERRRHERAGRAVRRSEPARPVRRARQMVPGQHESASFPSQRPLLRRRVRHLVDGHGRDVRSGEHGAGTRGQLRHPLRRQGPLRRREERGDRHPGLGHGSGDVDTGGEEMKIRIGVGAAGAASTPEALAELVAAVEALGFDSLWLSEVLTGPVLDPIVGLSWAAANNPRLKLGTTMLLPGRNVLRLAKQLASLDVLCKGRLLVTLVPGLTYAPERDAIGVDPKRRGAAIDEALPLLRRLWAGETVTHDGAVGSFRDVKLSPLPVQQPLEVWLGGTVPAALERCGRLSDGWLPSLCAPPEAAAGRIVIDDAAARAGRPISQQHFGMSIGYARTPIHPATARVMTARRPRSVELTPVGLPALRALVERFIAVGFSKFVVRPVAAPASWRAELEALSAAVGDLQT